MLEYLYTEKQYQRSIRILFICWGTNFFARLGLYAYFGDSFAVSSANLMMVFLSGVLVGLIIRAMIMRKKSADLSLAELGLTHPQSPPE